MSQRAVAIVLLASTALPMVTAGCASNGASSPTASEQAMIDQGSRLHRAIAPAVLNEDVNLRRYVQQVGQRLMEAAGEMHRAKIGPAGHFRSAGSRDGGEWMFGADMRFQLLDCDVANAFTPGGTHVYLYNGLFQRCESEEELAAAMAHVYAHLYARHRQQRSALSEEADAEESILALINNRHTPQEEQEADAVGFQLYSRAGWDPFAYGNLARRLQESQRAETARLMAEQLPPAALDWARPPIADARRFSDYQKVAQNLAGNDLEGDVELLLTAVPSCLTAADSIEQRNAQQQLLSPPVPLDTPAPFEKGPRSRQR